MTVLRFEVAFPTSTHHDGKSSLVTKAWTEDNTPFRAVIPFQTQS